MNKKFNFALVAFSTLLTTLSFAAEPCKAYVRVDMGYGFASGTKAKGPALHKNGDKDIEYQYNAGLDKDQRGMVGDIAVGYAFNDAMRGEVSFDFKPKMTAKAYNFKVETEEYGGSAKVLYDFNNNTSVTPFVFGGLGAMSIKPKVKPHTAVMLGTFGTPYLGQINNDNTLMKEADGKIKTFPSIKMSSKTVMTYQAGFGLAFKATEDISIDLTYGLGGKTDYRVLNNVATLVVPKDVEIKEENGVVKDKLKEIKFKNQLDQSLTLGIRFTI
jgi:opacity protein-like surface antigen